LTENVNNLKLKVANYLAPGEKMSNTKSLKNSYFLAGAFQNFLMIRNCDDLLNPKIQL